MYGFVSAGVLGGAARSSLVLSARCSTSILRSRSQRTHLIVRQMCEASGESDENKVQVVDRNYEEELPLTELSRLEIRVGKVVECERHPDADTLYVEKVDVGEDEPRTIVSGLVNFMSQEELNGRTVIVLCNLKPRAMRGIKSHGMLLCASNEDHTKVDPLTAPPDAAIGSLITFEGHRAAPMDAGNRASKAFDKVASEFNTDADGIARFNATPFMTEAGACYSPAKLQGSVS
uniref:tRNA-binding domain-containing protein n=1 Tax=Timspurckia oligopyrenoides TaxID=708627 RepID=A0A7S0ZE83_9RHOD|mmetsp:Transcript_1784/g.3197  ORF Transcript_1784/g.3197 Transcript_1784/m.3197 type:complete len:233 (+) Transcript_1784:52-750(+)